MSSASKLVLGIVLIAISCCFLATCAQAQSVISFQANDTTQPPSINGQWQPGEWDSATVYNLTVGSLQVKLRPTVRLLHDNSSLYGLVDVPSDYGGTFVVNGVKNWGYVILIFYYGTALSYPLSPTQLWYNLFINTNQTGPATMWYFISAAASTNQANPVLKHSLTATSLTTTSLTNVKHRIWEFSVQLYPYILTTPMNKAGTSIGFNVRVYDSGNDMMELVGSVQPGRLFFSETALPEYDSPLTLLALVILLPLVLIRYVKNRFRQTT